MNLNDDDGGFDLAEYAERQRQEEADPDFVYQPHDVKLLTPPKNEEDEVKVDKKDEEQEINEGGENHEEEDFYKPLNAETEPSL